MHVVAVLGPSEIGLLFVVTLLLFGGKRLPDLARGIGIGVRELRRGMSGSPPSDAED